MLTIKLDLLVPCLDVYINKKQKKTYEKKSKQTKQNKHRNYANVQCIILTHTELLSHNEGVNLVHTLSGTVISTFEGFKVKQTITIATLTKTLFNFRF